MREIGRDVDLYLFSSTAQVANEGASHLSGGLWRYQLVPAILVSRSLIIY